MTSGNGKRGRGRPVGPATRVERAATALAELETRDAAVRAELGALEAKRPELQYKGHVQGQPEAQAELASLNAAILTKAAELEGLAFGRVTAAAELEAAKRDLSEADKTKARQRFDECLSTADAKAEEAALKHITALGDCLKDLADSLKEAQSLGGIYGWQAPPMGGYAFRITGALDWFVQRPHRMNLGLVVTNHSWIRGLLYPKAEAALPEVLQEEPAAEGETIPPRQYVDMNVEFEPAVE